MEEPCPGVCSDAGDSDNAADVAASAPSLSRTPEADGEEVSQQPTSNKQSPASPSACSDVSGVTETESACLADEHGFPARLADGDVGEDASADCFDFGACAGSQDMASAPVESFENICSDHKECLPVAEGKDSEHRDGDVHMVESNPSGKADHDEKLGGSRSESPAQEMNVEGQGQGQCECGEDPAVLKMVGCEEEMVGCVRGSCDVPDEKPEETWGQSSAWSPPYEGGLRLDQLHDDVIFHIAVFLEARVVRDSLSKVCLRFLEMFDNEAYWKSRVFLRCHKPYPAVVSASDFSWVDACVAREDSYHTWRDWSRNTRHFLYGHNVNGEVDAVHLMKEGRLLASGDRNRFLNIVDLAKWDDSPGVQPDKQMADMLVHSDISHGGWIWSMASVGDTLITGSWDTHVRMFDLAAGCAQAQSFKCKSAVLCLYAEEKEVVASCFKEVAFFDRRSSALKMRIFHTKPVLSVVGNGQFIVSGSEDKSIVVFDRTAGKIFTTLKMDNYPLCMSLQDQQLWCGDRLGRLHLHNATGGMFSHVGTYDVSHKDKLTGVVATLGATFTCSGDKSVKVIEPTREPEVIASLDVHTKEVAKIDYNSGVLASAGGDECVGVWLPDHWDARSFRHLL
ncbi:F-box/WD repeat-containing protein 9 [Aplysia californica]|uniref:F-box/WD repeat-containing protein 9 n=1 Tax=Aplysia californica TaxID=6500 RepID=A0ABM1A1V3_APLCA|nr:F-box/WD repeat-containing protein 9 [Aplysia californica]